MNRLDLTRRALDACDQTSDPAVTLHDLALQQDPAVTAWLAEVARRIAVELGMRIV